MTGAEWEKLVYGLIAGWFLAQITTFAVWRFKACRIKRILKEELVDIRAQVKRNVWGIMRNLQAFGANVLEPSSTMPVSDPIFKAHYKDAVLHLSREERLNYQLIHGHVDQLNDLVGQKDRINASAWKEYQENEEAGSFALQMIEYRKLLKTCFVLCWVIDFHIRSHLESDKPSLEFGDAKHQRYLEMMDEANKRADALIEEGKSIDPSEFEGPGRFSVESPAQ